MTSLSQITDQIKSRLNLAELVGEYVPLKPAGRLSKGLCPFHQEKTPSFIVSQERQTWHCFGCGEGGDGFTFLEKMEGFTFGEALKALAARTGVVLPKDVKQDDGDRYRKLYEAMEEAVERWHYHLTKDPSGEIARQYAKQRGLNSQIAKEFLLGFALDDWQDLTEHLLKSGFSEQDLTTIGVSVRSEKTGKLHDRFRGRLMFPILDHHGRVVGVTGRSIPDIVSTAQEAKYINTPESAIYHKGRVLYGLSQAKQAIREKKKVVMVEGNLDVVASHLAGVKNVVAVSGTALTDDHLRLIKRYTDTIAFALDQDSAGVIASLRAVTLAWIHGCNVEAIVWDKTAGKDPDEVVSKDPAVWQQASEKTRPIMDYYFQKVLERLDVSQALYKKKAANDLLPVIAKLSSPIEREHYLKKLGEALDIEVSTLRGLLPQGDGKMATEQDKTFEQKQELPQQRLMSERLLALGITSSDAWEQLQLNWPAGMVWPETESLYNYLSSYYNATKTFDPVAWLNQLRQNFPAESHGRSPADDLTALLLLADEAAETAGTVPSIIREIELLAKRLASDSLGQHLRALSKAIRLAEAKGDEGEARQLTEEFSQLSKQLSAHGR
ncbi:MAG: DNA primase [bacterium]